MWTIISIYKVNKLRKSLTSEFTCSWFLSESSLPPELQRNVHCGILEKKCRCIFDAALAMRTTLHKKIKNVGVRGAILFTILSQVPKVCNFIVPQGG